MTKTSPVLVYQCQCQSAWNGFGLAFYGLLNSRSWPQCTKAECVVWPESPVGESEEDRPGGSKLLDSLGKAQVSFSWNLSWMIAYHLWSVADGCGELPTRSSWSGPSSARVFPPLVVGATPESSSLPQTKVDPPDGHPSPGHPGCSQEN